MSTAVRNLVNLQSVGVAYAGRPVLTDVSLGVAAGERIGVVGLNGGGKSTLLRLIAGVQHPDAGVVTRTRDLRSAVIGQGDDLEGDRTIRQELVGGRADHEWAGDAAFRGVLDGLLGGVGLARFPHGIDTVIGTLSGGERRRIALARLLVDGPELLLLDEPTNHLDIEGVDWLAGHLAARRGSLVVVTHDRWFLDAVCTRTWEVADGTVHQYDGGYAAYVLARAERERLEGVREERRRRLVRKELAWLRRGPPARTSKPRFRIDAANALIADEPQARDRAELLRFAGARLGRTALEAEDLSVGFGDRRLLHGVTWRVGPGDRVGLVGVNGSGKTTLMRALAGALEPSGGRVVRGVTVRLALLSQDAEEVPGQLRVLEALESVRRTTHLADGTAVTAGQLCERFGFRGARAGTLVRDLSGGERRRLQLMRLLMDEPNVLLLDEPTNDLDIDTLTALEDLLDAWAGTLVVVSHDRYFIERVCDDVHAITPDGGLRHLPGGVEEYVRLRARQRDQARPPAPAPRTTAPPGAVVRAARKDLQRIERDLDRLATAEAELHERMAANATRHDLLRDLQAEAALLAAERGRLEDAWMAAAELAGD